VPSVDLATAGGCTGTAANKSFYAEAAAKLPYDIYCAVLPSDYWVEAGDYETDRGGYVEVEYTNGRHFVLMLVQGNICEGPCDFKDALQIDEKIWLGEIGAYLYFMPQPGVAGAQPDISDPDAHGLFMAYAPAGTFRGYALLGMGMSKATFVKLAAAIIEVPNS
jgi:hypothetical protein